MPGTEYRDRLGIGAALVLLTVAVLAFDQYFPPIYPFLLVLVLLLAWAICGELRRLLPEGRPEFAWSLASVWLVLLANWPTHVWGDGERAWRDVLMAFQAVVLAGFLVEMVRYRGPGGAVARLSLLVWQV